MLRRGVWSCNYGGEGGTILKWAWRTLLHPVELFILNKKKTDEKVVDNSDIIKHQSDENAGRVKCWADRRTVLERNAAVIPVLSWIYKAKITVLRCWGLGDSWISEPLSPKLLSMLPFEATFDVLGERLFPSLSFLACTWAMNMTQIHKKFTFVTSVHWCRVFPSLVAPAVIIK